MLASMAVCLFCQAEILFANMPCRVCGKRQADHPSMGQSSYSVRPREEAAAASAASQAARQAARQAPRHESGPPSPAPQAAQAAARSQPAQATPEPEGEKPKVPSLLPPAAKAASKPAPPKPPSGVASPSAAPRGAGGPAFGERDLTSAGAPELSLGSPRPSSGALKPAPKPAAPSPAAPAKPAPAFILGVGGAEFDDDDAFSGDGPGMKLELDDGPSVSRAPAPMTSHAPGFDDDEGDQAPHGSSSALVSVSRSVAGGAPRAMSGAPREALAPTPEESAEDAEARAFGDYGPAPRSWWQAPIYTYRVKMRQAELRRMLVERKADAAKAAQAEEDTLVDFGERARAVAVKEGSYGKALDAITAAEKIMRERDTALAGDTDAHKERLAVIDERIAKLEGELSVAKSEERRIEGEMAEVEAQKQRAEAKMKRAEIEIRNVSSRGDGPKRATGQG
jgi:hypothetical protein